MEIDFSSHQSNLVIQAEPTSICSCIGFQGHEIILTIMVLKTFSQNKRDTYLA